MSQTKHFAAYPLPLLAAALICGWASAQSYRPAYQQPASATPATVIRAQSTAIRSAKRFPPAAKAAKPSPATPAAVPSPLSIPPEPAKVNLASGKLSVQANNSSLAQILQQIAKAGGMKIEGLQTSGTADPRVFGSYGPGAPKDVLSDLLNGASYNVVMLGSTPAGTPREMALSLRSPGGVPNPAPHPSAAAQNTESEDEVPQPADDSNTDTDDVQSSGSAAEPENNLVPPAGVQENEPIAPPPGAPGAPGTQQKVKTPQQILQELQNMRLQQQQQQ